MADEFLEAQVAICKAILADLKFYDKPFVTRDLVDNITLFVTAFTNAKAQAFYEATLRAYTRCANQGASVSFSDVMIELEALGHKEMVPVWQQQYQAVEKKPYPYKVAAQALLNHYLYKETTREVETWLKQAKADNIREEMASLIALLTNLSLDGDQECRPKEILEQARARNVYVPQSTGLSVLDQHIKGGFFRKNLVMWGAPSSAGKSSTCTSLAAERCRMHKPTLIQSFEMPKEDLLFRILCNLSLAPLDVVRDPNKASGPEEYEAIRQSEELVNRWVRIYDTRCKLPELEIRTRRTRAEFGVSEGLLVEVDHVGIIDRVSAKTDDWRSDDAMAQGLSDMSKRQDVSVLAFSQVNDEVTRQLKQNNRASNVKMRGSAGWYNASDVVIISCKHNGKRNGSIDMGLMNVTVIQVDKLRQLGGQQSRFCLKFDAQHGRLTNELVQDE